MTARDIYAELGLRRVVNAAATLTAIGGSTMPGEVISAMALAADSYVDMFEFQDTTGREIAELTHNEAAHVTSGCAAAIVLAVLACITRGSPAEIAKLPWDEMLPRNVLMHRVHRIPYDRAIELGGGRIVEVGNMLQTFRWELETAIDERSVAIFWVAGSHLPQTSLTLSETIEIAHARGLPVIVDAAAQLPPVDNLWHFTTEMGADLALFSGGKGLRGPQSSGLMVGSPELIAWVRANASPHQRLARALKVGKEEICGLLAAVRRYVALDHEELAASWELTVESWIHQLSGIPGVSACRAFPNEAGQPVPRLELNLDEPTAGVSADDLVSRLWERDPRIAVLKGDTSRVYVTPDYLRDKAEAELVIAAIQEIIREDSR